MTLLLCVCSGAWATDLEIPLTNLKNFPLDYGLVTITNTANTTISSNQLQVSKATGTFKIATKASGVYLKSISFTDANSSKNGGFTCTDGAYMTGPTENVYTYTAPNTSTTEANFQLIGSGGTAKMGTIIITVSTNYDVERLTAFGSISEQKIPFTSSATTSNIELSVPASGGVSTSSSRISIGSGGKHLVVSTKNSKVIKYIAIPKYQQATYDITCTSSPTGTYSNDIWTPSTAGNESVDLTLTVSSTVYSQELYVAYEAGAPVDPSITFNDGSYNVGDAALDLSSLFSSNSSGAVTYSITNAGTTGATIDADGTSFTATAAGTATVQASQAAATGYNAKTVTATITVTNLTTPTFTVTSTADYVIGNSLSLSSLITANTSDGAVSYTVKDAGTTNASIAEGVFTATAAGTAIVTIGVAETATYTAASQDVTITVMANPLGSHTVTFALTNGSSNVTGSSSSAKLGSFSTAFAVSNLEFNGSLSGSYSGGIRGTNNEESYDDTKYVDIAFTVADGYTFAPTAVSFSANPSSGTGAMKFKLALIDGNNNILSNDIACAKSTDNAVTFASGAFTGKLLSGTVHIRAYFYGAASDKKIYIKSPITVSGTVAVAKVVSSTDIALTDVKVNGSSITSAQLTTLKTADAYTLTMPSTYAGEPTVVFEQTTTTTYTEGDPDVAVIDVPATMDADDDNYIATATIDEIEYTVNLPIDKTPRLEADVTEVEVASAGPATGTATIKLTGAYLTGDASVAFASSVEGLAISPATITVTDGTVDQEFTVSYQSDAAVDEADVNLTFTVGAKSVVIPVSYSSTAAVTTITDVTGPKTWNFRAAGSADIASPASLRLIPLANASGFADSFDEESLSAKAQYFFYKGSNNYNCFQGSQLKFHTTVPGTVTVTFSNTGGSRPYRYLYVNGEATTYKSGNTDEVTTDPIAVEAGDVVLSGYIPNANDPQSRTGDVVGEAMLRIFSVVFTPTETVTIPAGKTFATFNSDNILDFSSTTDITAYTASVSGDVVTLTKVTAPVPAHTGLLLRGATAGATANVAIAASATAPTTNHFVAVTAEGGETVTSGYILATVDGNQGFYPVNSTSGNHVAKGKAYLATGSGARLSMVFDDEVTTGVATVEAKPQPTLTAVYNLNGQRVQQPQKGLYIVNGKKVLVP